MADEPSPVLEFATHEQIMGELHRRGENAKYLFVRTLENGEIRMNLKGWTTDAIGLAVYAKDRLLDLMKGNECAAEEDE